MTVSGDFIPDDTEGLPNYPVVLGLTLTPPIQGLLFLLLGVAAAVPLYIYLVQPAQLAVDDLKTQIETKEVTLRDQEANLQKVEAAKQRLEDAKQRRAAVLELFAGEQSLDVVLLDVYRQVSALRPSEVRISDEQLAELRKANEGLANSLRKSPDELLDPNSARIVSFAPSGPPAPIADGSYGEALNTKLLQQNFAVNMRGDFQQVIEMLRRLEEQRLVMNVSNFSLAPQGDRIVEFDVGVPIRSVNVPKLNVTFTLQTVVPTAQVFGEPAATTPGQPGAPPAPGATPAPGAPPAASPTP